MPPRRRLNALTPMLLVCIIGLPLCQDLSAQARTEQLKVELRLDPDEELFSRIGAVVVTPRGVLAVAQPQDWNIRVYRPGAKKPTMLGRRGEGPGELRLIGHLGTDSAGASITVADGLRGLTVFRLDTNLSSNFRSTQSMSAPPGNPSDTKAFGLFHFQARTQKGDFLYWYAPVGRLDVPTWAPQAARDQIPWLLLDSDHRLTKILAIQDRGDCLVERTVRGNPVRMGIPLCAPQVIYVSPSARYLAHLRPLKSPDGDAWSIAVSIVEIDTGSRTSYQIAIPELPIPSAMADSVRAAFSRIEDQERQQRMLSVPLPEFLDPIRSGALQDDGTLWLSIESAGANPNWLSHDVSGNPLVNATAPREWSIRSANAGRIAVVWADPSGAEGILLLSHGAVGR